MSSATSPMALLSSPYMPQKLRAAIYVRKSNKDDEGRTKSCDEQLAHCHKVAEHYGFDLSDDRIYIEPLGAKGEWYWDDGTGRFPEPYRSELTRMVRDAEAGLIDVIICWRSDRYFRDAGVANALADVHRRTGIRLICGVRDMDVSSASGLFQMTTEAANNRRWRDTISEDIIRDHQWKAEMGMFTRNPTCLGYRSKGVGTQEAEPVYEELEFVNRVFRLFLSGEGEHGPMGTQGIANYLMDQGVRWPKGVNNHKITRPEFIAHTQVRFVLGNCMYAGFWRHNGREYECDKLLVPVLDEAGQPTGERRTAVPVELYQRAQEKLARAARPGKRSLSDVHLATGLAVCARCGRPLVVSAGAASAAKAPKGGTPAAIPPRYRCRRRRGDRPCEAGSCVGVQESVLDEWLLSELAPVLVSEMAAIRASAGRAADQEKVSRIERKLAEVRKRETSQLAFLVGGLDAEQFAAIAAQFRAEREALVREARNLHDRIDNAERLMPDLSEEAIASLPKAALKDALARALAFVAIGKSATGIVALTRWGSYIAAPFRKGDPSHGELSFKTYIAPPSPEAALNCLSWLPDPEEFVRGRRDSLGKSIEGLTDEEVLPGVLRSGDDDADAITEIAIDQDVTG